jgi:cell division protease FtsH
LSGAVGREGVVAIGAANYPDRIDPALLRPGRLEKIIEIPLPDAEALKGIFRFHLQKDLAGANLSSLAVASVGMTGADVEQIVRVGRRRARTFKRALLLEDLLAVLGEALKDMPGEYLERIAIHEAGHAIVAVLLGVSRNVNVSLVHPGSGRAATFLEPQLEAVTRKVVKRRMAVALAGRAAEKVLLGDVAAGSGGPEGCDLELATRMACAAVSQWGLSSRYLGWIVSCDPDQVMVSHPDLAEEVQIMIARAYARSRVLIREHQHQVRAVACALLKRRALAHDDIIAAMARTDVGAKKAGTQRRQQRQA